MKNWIIAAATTALFVQNARAACQQWGEAYQVGKLDKKIREASGLEWSPLNPDTLYHINDSGDGPHVYVTDRQGKGTRKVMLKGSSFRDSEDITLGPCPDGKGQCFVYGDIGDGGLFFKTPKLTLLRESELSKSAASILASVKLSLEGGNQDMEGMALHPNGDLFLATKEYDHPHTKIMRVPRSALLGKSAKAAVVATLDLAKVGSTGEEALVTGMDISADGRSFLLLTYQEAMEVDFDLGTLAPKGLDAAPELSSYAKAIQIPKLPQQEAIAYIEGGSFLYDTEEGGGGPVMRVDCLLP